MDVKIKVKSQKSKVKIKEYFYLLLDPGTEDGRLRFFVLDRQGEKVTGFTFTRHTKVIEMLLERVEEKLKGVKRELKDIKGILVVRGGESFSAVRGVHAIANALAWSLGIPSQQVSPLVRGERRGGCAGEERNLWRGTVKTLKRRKHFTLLLPAYSREPNITL